MPARANPSVSSGWVVAPSTGRHWDLLDGLRGLAILMVVASHAIYANPDGPRWRVWFSEFCATGAYGVHMFFVLSGFLISYPFFLAQQRDPDRWYPPGYVTRRCLKIFPPYYLTILLLAVYYLWRDHDLVFLRLAGLWAVGVPHFVFEPLQFNSSFWSLWVELEFYLLLPLFFWTLRKRGLWPTALIVSGTLLVVPFVARALSWPSPFRPGMFMVYLGGRFPNGLTNFLWGVLFAGLFVASGERRGFLKHRAKVGYVGLVLLIATLTLATWLRHSQPPTWWAFELLLHLVGLATFLTLFLVFDPDAFGARLFSTPVLKFIGLVSYEWFLLHQPALLEARDKLGGSHGSLGQYVLIVGVPVVATFGLAVLIYHYFSAPIIQWGRARLRKLGTTG